MVSASFIFRVGEYDEDFHRLNALIDDAAKAIEGYLGSTSWQSADGLNNSIYYWQNREALELFAQHPKHIEAKRQYERWYQGFHVIISEVIASYGDGNIAHHIKNQVAL